MSSTPAAAVAYDRLAELRALDATFAGVRGLVASGATRVPRIFRVTDPEPSPKPDDEAPGHSEAPLSPPRVPTIDLAAADHEAVVESVRRAAAEWGLFLVTGHGVPEEVAAAALGAARAFHDADGGEGSEKARLYTRDPAKAVKYSCNFDLYQSSVANWRDTLYLRIAPDPPADGEMPENCRDAFFDYARHTKRLLGTLYGLLSEALGLNPSYLTDDMECNKGQIMLFHYYPPCPEPEVAIGITRHSDTGFLTILLQDDIGGLQVLHDHQWIDVPPTPGAFVVNVGDLMQMMSNDKFSSAEHRVVAKKAGPRVSIACFTSHTDSTRMYGPIKELLSDESPPLYRETLARDYITHYYSVGLGPKKAIYDFRL